MQISKIKIRNALGISELNVTPGQVTEFVGVKGAGKTSFLDALVMGLSNKNVRTDFIKKGEYESEIIIELDNGTIIDRKKRYSKSDYISVKDTQSIIGSPETYLRNLFSEEQFNPLRFIELPSREQSKILLSLVHIDWCREDFVKWFGEIPIDEKISLDTDHILTILDFLGSGNSQWFLKRESINRQTRERTAVRNDKLRSLPDAYQVDKWRAIDLSVLYGKVNQAIEVNQRINKAGGVVESLDLIEKNLQAEYETKTSENNRLVEKHENNMRQAARDYELQIKDAVAWERSEIERIKRETEEKKNQHTLDLKNVRVYQNSLIVDLEHKIKEDKQALSNAIELEKTRCNNANEYLQKHKVVDVEPIMAEAKEAENMKTFIPKHDEAVVIDVEINKLNAISAMYTEKIEKARTLPGELLEFATMPVEGLSVVDGEVLIHGLSVRNLSSGEKLELAVDIAKEKAGDLKVVLVDKLEGLDTKSRELFINKCKQSGLQFFMTRVTDDEFEVRSL